jgi:hypothetical protein
MTQAPLNISDKQLKIVVFWLDNMLHPATLKVEATGSSEVSVTTYETLRYNNATPNIKPQLSKIK